MSHPTVRPWDDDDRRAVAALITAGRSASEIAGAFGISRNAVIGRIHRNTTLRAALQARGPFIRIVDVPPVKPQPKAAVAIATIAVWPRAKNRPGEKEPPTMPDPPPPLADMRRVPLLDLRRAWCKWPIDEDKAVIGHFIFCGRDTGGPSYCNEHDRIKVAR